MKRALSSPMPALLREGDVEDRYEIRSEAVMAAALAAACAGWTATEGRETLAADAPTSSAQVGAVTTENLTARRRRLPPESSRRSPCQTRSRDAHLGSTGRVACTRLVTLCGMIPPCGDLWATADTTGGGFPNQVAASADQAVRRGVRAARSGRGDAQHERRRIPPRAGAPRRAGRHRPARVGTARRSCPAGGFSASGPRELTGSRHMTSEQKGSTSSP